MGSVPDFDPSEGCGCSPELAGLPEAMPSVDRAPKHAPEDWRACYFAESALIDNDTIAELQALAEDQDARNALKRMGFVKNEYEETAGFLTFAERKVSIRSIERTFAAVEDEFMPEAKRLAKESVDLYAKELAAAVEAKDWAKLAKLEPAFGGKMATLYSRAMKQLFETGKKTASDEIGVVSPATDPDVRGVYMAQALAMEDKISTETGQTGREEALYQLQRGATAEWAMERAVQAMELRLSKIVQASGTQAIAGAFNAGRLAVFEKYRDRLYGFQYTAVIDRRTTNFCLSLNGRVIGADDPDFFRLAPPNHVGCRSFWVEILKDEYVKPEIAPIPDSIPRNKTGLTNFQDLQKVYPYSPKQAPTPEERRAQRAGVLRSLVSDLRDKGVKLKSPPDA